MTEKVEQAVLRLGHDQCQWLANRLAFLVISAFYNGDWLMRAGTAKAGLYGNSAAEAGFIR